jgi:hypothetical protein
VPGFPVFRTTSWPFLFLNPTAVVSTRSGSIRSFYPRPDCRAPSLVAGIIAPKLMAPQRLTDKEVSTYLVYRIKVNELIHLHMLWFSIKDGQCGESISGTDNRIIRETLRTVAMAWFSTIVDRNGLNIFPLWEKMFPQYQKRIALYRAVIQPKLDLLRAFRDRTAFHAEPVFSKFFAPRKDMLDHIKEITTSVQHFLTLSKFLILREHTADPDLQSRMLDIILNTELELDCNIRRGWLIETNLIDRTTLFGTSRF